MAFSTENLQSDFRAPGFPEPFPPCIQSSQRDSTLSWHVATSHLSAASWYTEIFYKDANFTPLKLWNPPEILPENRNSSSAWLINPPRAFPSFCKNHFSRKKWGFPLQIFAHHDQHSPGQNEQSSSSLLMEGTLYDLLNQPIGISFRGRPISADEAAKE